MRILVLYLIIAATMFVGVRRWFVCLCAYIVLSALFEHESMPRSLGGITGLNVGNVLLCWTLLMCFLQERGRPPAFVVSPRARWFVALYLVVFVVAYARTAIDLDSIQGPGREEYGSLKTYTIEFLLFPLKYLLPGFLLVRGLRNRDRMWAVLACLGVMAVLYAVVVIKNLPVYTLWDEDRFMAKRHAISNMTGLHANDMALVMVQALWGFVLCARHLRGRYRVAAGVGAMLTGLAAALCHSRGGYLACAMTAIVIGVLCWRWLLIAAPVVAIAVCSIFPTIPLRLLSGVGVTDVSGSNVNDWTTISAGRTDVLWPAAWDQAFASPLVGYGRLSILRTGMYERILEGEDEVPEHPHSAYLEMLCDGGIVSLAVVLAGLVGLLFTSARLTRNAADPAGRTIASICLASLTVILIMAISGQSFWPRTNSLMTICAIVLLLRLSAADTRSTGPVRVAARRPRGIRGQRVQRHTARSRH